MKKSTVLLIAAAVMLSSCGTAAQMASSDNGQRFADGIYSNAPSIRTKAEKMEDKAETEALVEKTKASEIYLFGDRKDTVLIPDNMAATIKYDRANRSTVVSVYENPYDWRNGILDPWDFYTPYSIGSTWYWSRHWNPWYYNGAWAYSTWRYHSWYYDPWYYDPWYYSGWYDPWYYGGFWGVSPWYGWYPHYAGWYGGWYDPYWGHHLRPGYIPGHHHGGPSHHPDKDHKPRIYNGTRHSTGSDRVFAGTSSLRGGGTVSSRPVNRNTASSASGSTVTSRPAASKSSITRTSSAIRDRQTAASKNPGTVTTRPSSGRTTVTRTAPGARPVDRAVTTSSGNSAGRTTVTRPANHRRPTVTVPKGTVSGNTSSYSRSISGSNSSSQSYRPERQDNNSSYNRSNSQTYERNSATQSYNRSSSSSSSFGRSSSSAGSATRSTGGGGSSFSRSGGSSGGGMRR